MSYPNIQLLDLPRVQVLLILKILQMTSYKPELYFGMENIHLPR
jgi:hypothetical protein